MPIYEYRCSACGYEFEKMVRLSQAEQQQECPGCHSQDTRKMISNFAAGGGSDVFSGYSSSSSCSSSGRFT
jgi:putative FmdB family regulatory protein